MYGGVLLSNSCLESMGALPFKMRIHAKEDVYEATRQRINALEEERLHDWYNNNNISNFLLSNNNTSERLKNYHP